MRTVSLIVIAAFACAAAHAADDRRFERQVAAEPRGIVEISSRSGQIHVTGWDRPEVDVRSNIDGDDQAIEITSEKGRTMIKVQYAGHSFFGGDVDLQVRVPRDSEIEITAVSANVESTNLLGAQRLRAVSGNIRAEIAQANVEAKTVSGDVVLRGRGQPATVRVNTISGSLRVEHGAGELEASTVSGDVNLRLDSARSVRVRTTSGDFGFTGKLTHDATFDSESVSGGLTVHAASESGYQYEVGTFSGDIRDCFAVEPERTSKYGPGHRLNGVLGKGSARVRLKTMSGDVELCDKP